MCGICGLSWEDEETLSRMVTTLKHRGPDAEGRCVGDGVSLGHRRLAIIDLSRHGAQPMEYDGGRLRITFNGEIFNYRELKMLLRERGYGFRSASDTEVILAAYKEWGPRCLDRLDGQFAFCIHDAERHVLFLVRDRLGINPLYYRKDARGLLFASELKTILAAGGKRTLDHEALSHYLAFGHTPSEQTILKECRKLEPGHYLVYDLRQQRIIGRRRYWDVRQEATISEPEEAKRKILELMEKAVRSRLVADVPVGAFLSGGVDSSAVVAMITWYKKELNTFSVKFDKDGYDESAYGERVAKLFGTHHHIVTFSAKDIRRLLKKLAYHYDEPFGDPSMVPTFLVSEVARRHVTVSLSGDGGDELFGGYKAHQLYRSLRFQRILPRRCCLVAEAMLRPLPGLRKAKTFFEIGALPEEERYARLMSNVPQRLFVRLTGMSPRSAYRRYARKGSFSTLPMAIDHDLHRYLPDDILTKVDRASLAHGLESRPPLLDHHLVELAARIDPLLKLRGKEGKAIFKEAFRGVLPDDILYRKKQGFSVPLKEYLLGELRPLVEEKVLRFRGHGLLDRETLREITRCRDSSETTLTWRILMLNHWWEMWMMPQQQARRTRRAKEKMRKRPSLR